MLNFYEILGINETSTLEEIKGEYRRMATRWHPDRNPDNRPLAEEKFKKIGAAYKVLANPQERAEYDAELASQRASNAEQQQTKSSSHGMSEGEAEQMFFEQMLDLAIELASRGFNAEKIAKMMLALDCPESIARAVAASAVKFSGSKPEQPSSPHTEKDKPEVNNIGYLIQPLTARKQTLHGLISDTVVVQSKEKSTTAATVIAVGFFIFIMVCILAAVAIPAYSNYTKKTKAADAHAQDELGLKYARGEGVPKDVVKAVKLFQLAAAQGDAGAQNSLGVMYSRGDGVAKDAAKAVELYQLSAAQGHDVAANQLAKMIEAGVGVQKDFNIALTWYREAARLGNKEAAERIYYLEHPQSTDQQQRDAAVQEIESCYPELNPKSPRYSQQATDNIHARQKFYMQQGYSSVDAIKMAVSNYRHILK